MVIEFKGYILKKIEGKDMLAGQFTESLASAASDAEPRIAIPNPPPIKAPMIAKIFLDILK